MIIHQVHLSLLQYYGSVSTLNNLPNSTDINFDSQNVSGGEDNESKGISEMYGLAVFKYDKLVGELTPIQTLAHMIISNDIKSCTITIPSPTDETVPMDVYVYNKTSPKIKVEIINETPYIDVSLNVEAKVLSVTNNSDFLDDEYLELIQNNLDYYLYDLINNYLYTISKDFESDINNFGKHALILFNTNNDFLEYNWLDNFKDSFFNINISSEINSSFLLSNK